MTLGLILKRGNETSRCAISVKSNRQLTVGGFNNEFVADAWEQWNSTAASGFNRATDLLGLIVGVIDAATLEEWHRLQKQDFASTPERMVQRLSDSQQSSATQRSIFESLHKARNEVRADPVETARLAARIRVLPFVEGEEGKYINLCSEVVLDGSVEEGTKLWARLQQLAAENRATGGFFDLAKLVGTLRPVFELRDYPDYEADWKRIEAVSKENAAGVGKTIGGNIQLPRRVEKATLTDALSRNKIVVLAGESGSGKSAVVAQAVSDPLVCMRLLWLSAEQLSKPCPWRIDTVAKVPTQCNIVTPGQDNNSLATANSSRMAHGITT